MNRVSLQTWTAIVLWSLAYVFTKIGLIYFDEIALSVFRYLTVGIVALCLLLYDKAKIPTFKNLLWLILLSLSGFFLNVLFYNLGANYVSVSLASLLMALSPLLSAIVSILIFKERINNIQKFSLFLSFIGSVIICVLDHGMQGDGVLWILFSMICFTIYNLIGRYKKLPYTAMETMEYQLVITMVFFLFLMPKAIFGVKEWNIYGFIVVLFLGLFCSGVGFILWNQSLRNTDSTAKVTNCLFAEPILTSIFGFFFFQEIPSMGTVTGGCIILIALYLFDKEVNSISD